MTTDQREPPPRWVSILLTVYVTAVGLGLLVSFFWAIDHLPEITHGISRGTAVLFKAAGDGWAAGSR